MNALTRTANAVTLAITASFTAAAPVAADDTAIAESHAGPVTIVVEFTTKPGMEDTAKAIVNRLIHDVTAEEGNVQVAMFEDPEDPRTFLFVESFVSAEAEKSHTQTPHMAEFYAATEEFLARPADVKYWTPFGMMDGAGRDTVRFAN